MNTNNSGANDVPLREDPVKNVGQFTQHIAYWFDDGSIVVRVDNSTIYKIHLSLLTKLSSIMNSILTIPDGKAPDDPTREGTLMYPLFLPGTKAEEFNDFLFWIYRTEWESLDSQNERERICTHLLKLSHLWDIAVGKSYAISVLETMNLSPIRRLELAGMFTITDWVQPAVASIINNKLRNLTDDDVRAIGWKVYSILAKAKEKLEEETRRTAFVPPRMAVDPSWECTTHASCLAIWPKLWVDRIGRSLLHADAPMKLHEIRGKVLKDETFKHAQLSKSCRCDIVLICTGITFAEESIIIACTEAIVNYHKSLV
ncbi:hypothetical protein K438DRAFT_1991792 [Mycena galopus ATCC 62051]|nr:hypothetical protein K438DRAFT_1991792 [Mycena galopus ATCC 62051]